MDAQELEDPEKVSTIWVKNLNKTMNKMNNTASSMIGLKPKDAIELGTVPVNIQKKLCCPRMDYIDIFINVANNMETKKDERQTLFGVKLRIDQIELYKNHRGLHNATIMQSCLALFAGQTNRAFVREELMHIPEDTQAPPD